MTQQVLAWTPTREQRLRASDRSRVQAVRAKGRPFRLFALLAGPGVLVMLGENDGPSMLSYATTGATFGVGFFVPFIVLTFFMAYVVQEMVVRIGVATRRGHAELIYERFGPGWGAFAMLDLVLGNLFTLVTEFIAIQAGAMYFGISPLISVPAAVVLIAAAMSARRYVTWERFVLALAAGNLLFVPAALFAHPDTGALASAMTSWGPIPGGIGMAFLTLLLANIGATVTPWMLFFQQSAVVDKGLDAADLPQARIDTATGAAVASLVAIATVVAASTLFTHHVGTAGFATGADFATALRPFIGSTGAALFALGMIEAGIVAAMTISTSSAYGIGEVLRCGGSLNSDFARGWKFYAASFGSVALAGGAVLVPGAPLLAISITVNVIATLLMAPALLFVLLLANDREIMGRFRNTVRANAVAGSIVVGIAAIGAVYAVLTVIPLFTGKGPA